MSMEVKHLPPAKGTLDYTWTKVKVTGNIISTTNFKHLKRSCDIVKLDKDHYIIPSEFYNSDRDEFMFEIDTGTGELKLDSEMVHEFKHTENRFEGYKGLLQTFANLRDIINCNVTDVRNVHWCTLTYGENMTDTERLYNDFKTFWKRFKYYCKTHNLSRPEYISAVEPQGRGAWHIHLLILWASERPYIPHDDFWRLWSPEGFENKRDFVKIQSLYKDGQAIDNVGAYLTTYLTDTLTTDDHKRQKHERLKLYPTGINVYRTSRNIRRPEVEYMSEKFAKEKVRSAKQTFEKRISLEDKETGFSNEIIYRYYNTNPRESKQSD